MWASGETPLRKMQVVTESINKATVLKDLDKE